MKFVKCDHSQFRLISMILKGIVSELNVVSTHQLKVNRVLPTDRHFQKTLKIKIGEKNKF